MSVTGSATTTTDKAVLDDLGDPASDTYFNEGTDPVALKVEVDHGGWWASPGTIRTAIGFAKAKFTGEEPDVGTRGDLA